MDSIDRLAANLVTWFAELDSVLVAFSGGVDSAVVANAAQLALRSSALAVTADSPSLARAELALAQDLAGRIGIQHEVILTRENLDPRYQRNDSQRCYFCKSHLFESLHQLLQQRYPQAVIVTGTNLDDLSDFRPGLKAAQEAGVRAPLAELQLTKSMVREIAAYWQLPVADKPASPCLASRIAYGVEVTPERLKFVEQAEEVIRSLGLIEFRVRYHAGDIARIEVPTKAFDILLAPEVRQALTEKLRQVGFRFVTLDLEGFRSGSMNQLVQIQ